MYYFSPSGSVRRTTGGWRGLLTSNPSKGSWQLTLSFSNSSRGATSPGGLVYSAGRICWEWGDKSPPGMFTICIRMHQVGSLGNPKVHGILGSPLMADLAPDPSDLGLREDLEGGWHLQEEHYNPTDPSGKWLACQHCWAVKLPRASSYKARNLGPMEMAFITTSDIAFDRFF